MVYIHFSVCGAVLLSSLNGLATAGGSINRCDEQTPTINGLATAGGGMNRCDEQTPTIPNGSSSSSTSAAAVDARESLSDNPIEKEKKVDTDKVKYVKEPGPLTPEEQGKLVEDVNDLFEVRLVS